MARTQVVDIGAAASNTAYTGTAGGTTLPNAADGNPPKFCLISSTTDSHFRTGKGAQTAVATDTFLPAKTMMIIRTAGHTHFSAIQDSAGGNFNVTPLEWSC